MGLPPAIGWCYFKNRSVMWSGVAVSSWSRRAVYHSWADSGVRINPGVLYWVVSVVYFSFYFEAQSYQLLRLAFHWQSSFLTLPTAGAIWSQLRPFLYHDQWIYGCGNYASSVFSISSLRPSSPLLQPAPLCAASLSSGGTFPCC